LLDLEGVLLSKCRREGRQSRRLQARKTESHKSPGQPSSSPGIVSAKLRLALLNGELANRKRMNGRRAMLVLESWEWENEDKNARRSLPKRSSKGWIERLNIESQEL
jgi:hypothetical protein